MPGFDSFPPEKNIQKSSRFTNGQRQPVTDSRVQVADSNGYAHTDKFSLLFIGDISKTKDLECGDNQKLKT